MSTKSKKNPNGIRHVAHKVHADAIEATTGKKPVKWHPHRV